MFWSQIASFTIRNRVYLLMVLLLGTLWMAFEATKIKISYDFAKVVPANDTDFIDYQAFKAKFGEDGSVLVAGVKTDKIFQLDWFNAWYDLSEKIEKTAGVEKVLSVGKAYLIDKKEETDELGNDKGRFILRPILDKKPESQAELDSIAGIIKNLTFYKGLLLNDSGDATILGITLTQSALDSKDRIRVVEEIEKLADSFSVKFNTEIHFSGLPYIRTVYAVKVKNELQWFTLFSLIVTTLFMWFFFRSFSAIFYSLIVVLVGVVFTLGSVSLFGYKVSILIGVIPPLIVIIGIQNCIYLLNVYHQEFRLHRNKMLAITRVTSKNGLALFLTNVTTAIGFGVFNFTGSSLLDEFSIISAINIMVVYVISAIILPIVFTYLPPPSFKQTKHLDNKNLSGFMQWCRKIVFGHRWSVYLVLAIVTLVSLWGMTQVKSIGFIVDDIPKKDKAYTDLKFLEKEFKGVMPFEIQIDGKKKGAFRSQIKNFEKMDQLTSVLAEYPQFTRPVSMLEMIKFSSQAFHGYSKESYALPSADEFVALRSYLKLKNQGENSQLRLRSMIDSNWQVARLSVQMADVGSVETDRLRKEIKLRIDSIFDPSQFEVKITGTSIIYLKGNQYLIDNLTGSMMLALILNSILMAFLFLSWRMILISLVPNILPLLVTLGIMGYFQIHLKPSTIIIFSITYGISIDFTIHFLAKYRYYLKKNEWVINKAVAETIMESGVSIVYTSVILTCGFIIFAFSSFGGTVALGVLTSIALFVGMFMNLLLLPAMLLSLEKVINMRRELGKAFVELEDDELNSAHDESGNISNEVQ